MCLLSLKHIVYFKESTPMRISIQNTYKITQPLRKGLLPFGSGQKATQKPPRSLPEVCRQPPGAACDKTYILL